jgi:cytochrome c peroxidase
LRGRSAAAHFTETTDRLQGTGFLLAEADNLAAFLTLGLKPPPNRHLGASPTAPQAMGKALFHDPVVGCAGCHAGPTLTNGKAYDVGTATAFETKLAVLGSGGTAFDTPSLLHLHATAPYLHDGSAKALDQVLMKTIGKLGDVSKLTTTQRAALVAYLLTL